MPSCQQREEDRTSRANQESKEEDIWDASPNVWSKLHAYASYAVKGCPSAWTRTSKSQKDCGATYQASSSIQDANEDATLRYSRFVIGEAPESRQLYT
jgi:hypothetical protein